MIEEAPKPAIITQDKFEEYKKLCLNTKRALDVGVRSSMRFEKFSFSKKIQQLQWFTAMRSIGYLLVFKASEIESSPMEEEEKPDIEFVAVPGDLHRKLVALETSKADGRIIASSKTTETFANFLPQRAKIAYMHFLAGTAIFNAYSEVPSDFMSTYDPEAESHYKIADESEAA